MALIVQKYGGTSVGSPARVHAVADQVAAAADLVAGQAAAIVGIHRPDHVVGQGAQCLVDLGDRFRFGPQNGVSDFDDF